MLGKKKGENQGVCHLQLNGFNYEKKQKNINNAVELCGLHLQLTSVPMLVWSACTSKMPALSREKRAKLQKMTRSLPYQVWLTSRLLSKAITIVMA